MSVFTATPNPLTSFVKQFQEVVHGTALPVAGMPKPSLCEINDDDQ